MKNVKICGIIRQEDALLSFELGAWAIGFIFVKQSSRYIEPAKAREITLKLPKQVEKVGVFANSGLSDILEVCELSEISMIQLHGDESPQFCKQILLASKLPVIKAFRVQKDSDINSISDYKGIVSKVLLDSFNTKTLGGTGEMFNWDIALKAKNFSIPLILAGGVNSANIKNAFSEVQPYAVDVSSGVEKQKGIKDPEKLKELFKQLND